MKEQRPFNFHEEARIVIRGRQWVIGRANLRQIGHRGRCMAARKAGVPNLIVICSAMPKRGPMHMRTAIHETLHAAMPGALEEQVQEAADIVAKVLIKLGYSRRDATP